MSDDKHHCELAHAPWKEYGAAIAFCAEDEDGTLWVGNYEYCSQVDFCPVCGYKAKVPIPPKRFNPQGHVIAGQRKDET